MDIAALEDLFAPVGPVQCRKMFGGIGVYRDGWMFALEAYGEAYLKCAVADEPEFLANGCKQFFYEGKPDPVTGQPKITRMSYWTVPEAAFDDADMLRRWALRAIATAASAPKAKAKPGTKAKPGAKANPKAKGKATD